MVVAVSMAASGLAAASFGDRASVAVVVVGIAVVALAVVFSD